MLRGEIKRDGKRMRVTIFGPRQFGRGERVMHTYGTVDATARHEQQARRALATLGITEGRNGSA